MPIPSLSLRPRTHSTHAKDASSPLKSSQTPPPDDSGESDVARPLTRPLLPVSSHSSTTDSTKRRSFLPQPGDLKYVSSTDAARPQAGERKASSDSLSSVASSNAPMSSRETGLPSAKQGRLRPRAMYQPTSARGELRPEADGVTAARTMPPPSIPNKSASSRSLPLSRTQSLRKPAAPTQVAQPANTRSHARTQSTNTVAGSREASTERRVPQERPKSLLVPPSGAGKIPSKASTDATASGTARLTRLTALKRAADVRAKPEVPDSSASASGTRVGLEPEHTALPASAKSREPPKEEPRKKPRAAFSTLQQHFTPRKVAKAPTSAFLHPPAPDVGTDTISPELASVQAELLQLHLLHESSGQVTREWEMSARKSLHRKFDEVTSLYHVMREEERHGQEQKNIRALRDWNSGHVSAGFAEQIQLLSGPLQELPSLVESGGRFERLQADFCRWLAWAEDIAATRERHAEEEFQDLKSAEGLGDSWKAENAALVRKLTSFSRDLERLAQPAPGSSIGTIVITCKELVSGLLAELHIMLRIESDMVEREKEWVEEGLKAIARGVGAHLGKDEGEEAWRM